MPENQGHNARVELPSRVSACIETWHLQDISRLSGGFRSEVFACTTSSGDVAAELLGRLHRVSPEHFPFPALEQIYRKMEELSREDAAYEQRTRGAPTLGMEGLRRLDGARAIAMKLCATTEQPVLLHGDFLDKNLLWNGTDYVAIDSIPSIGDPCSDIGFFAACHPPATAILPRATAIAGRMDLEPHRCQQWAAVWTVLQTCQAWREDQAAREVCLLNDEFEHLLGR
jgi:streptomycin 6-kinase